MGTKPTTTLRWADSGGLTITPPAGKLDKGFVKGEPPPAEFLNDRLKLAGQWSQFVHDRQAIAANADELAIFRNSAGYARETIDRYGYRGGHVDEWTEDWRLTDGGPTGTLANGYWVQTGTGEYNVETPSAVYASRSVALKADNTQISNLFGPDICFFTQERVFAQEWDAVITPENGGNAAQYLMGIVSDVVGGPLAYFYSDTDVSPNWRCWTGATDTDSGVAVPVVASTPVRLKIAIVGDSNHAGANELIHYYVNNVLVATNTPTVADAKLSPFFKVQNPNIGTYMYLNVGTVKARWNLSLNPTVI